MRLEVKKAEMNGTSKKSTFKFLFQFTTNQIVLKIKTTWEKRYKVKILFNNKLFVPHPYYHLDEASMTSHIGIDGGFL